MSSLIAKPAAGYTVITDLAKTARIGIFVDTDGKMKSIKKEDALKELAQQNYDLSVEWAIDGSSPPAATTNLSAGDGVTPIRDFSTAQENLIYRWDIPTNIDTSKPVSVRTKLITSNATGMSSEGVVFSFSGFAAGNGDSLNGTVGSAVDSEATGVTTAQYDYVHTGWVDITITNLAASAGGRAFLKVERDYASKANDTYNQLIGMESIEIRWYVEL